MSYRWKERISAIEKLHGYVAAKGSAPSHRTIWSLYSSRRLPLNHFSPATTPRNANCSRNAQLSEPRWKVLDGLETCLRSVPGGTTNPWVGAADLWEASFGLRSDVVVLSGALIFIRVLGLHYMVISDWGSGFVRVGFGLHTRGGSIERKQE